jgi:hypothetical protein
VKVAGGVHGIATHERLRRTGVRVKLYFGERRGLMRAGAYISDARSSMVNGDDVHRHGASVVAANDALLGLTDVMIVRAEEVSAAVWRRLIQACSVKPATFEQISGDKVVRLQSCTVTASTAACTGGEIGFRMRHCSRYAGGVTTRCAAVSESGMDGNCSSAEHLHSDYWPLSAAPTIHQHRHRHRCKSRSPRCEAVSTIAPGAARFYPGIAVTASTPLRQGCHQVHLWTAVRTGQLWRLTAGATA